MVHPIYTVSQVAVELEQCTGTPTVLEAASGVITMLTVSLTGQLMKCGSIMRVQPDLRAVHRSNRSSICLYLNILALAHTGNVLRSLLVARPLRLCREPADDVRRIRQPVRRNK
jgi:hypothetical protein